MIKVVQSWRYTPDRPREDAERHYLTTHLPMGLALLEPVPGFIRYVQNRVVRRSVFHHNEQPAVEAKPAYDRSIELYFRDQASMQEMYAQPGAVGLWNDHPNFMAVGENSLDVYELEEVTWAWRGPDGSYYQKYPLPGQH